MSDSRWTTGQRLRLIRPDLDRDASRGRLSITNLTFTLDSLTRAKQLRDSPVSSTMDRSERCQFLPLRSSSNIATTQPCASGWSADLELRSKFKVSNKETKCAKDEGA